MIKSFKSREARRLFDGRFSRRLPSELQHTAARKLEMLNAASELASLRVPPANRLERLKGQRAGQYSIRVNDQWRICFIWRQGHAYNVAIVDYHR